MHLIPKTNALCAALLLSSTFLFPLTGSAEAQDSRRPVVSADQCQLLTEGNFELCCVARNRSQILTPESAASCPPVTTALLERVMRRLQDGEQDRSAQTRADRAAAPDEVDRTPTASVDKDAKNNNGLGNGSEPGDSPSDSKSDVAGVDPSNPSHGGDKGGGAGDKGKDK
jgi:hypothetical protein